MSLDQLRTVVAIADEGTMTAAAEKLHISQPPLSRQLADLEHELGTRLFERRPRGMQLMPAGVTFVAHARQILAAIDAAVVAVRQETTLSSTPTP
jgi:DNA-binding transcriptional LysR family regulator